MPDAREISEFYNMLVINRFTDESTRAVDEDALMTAMQTIRSGFLKGATVQQLISELGEKRLIVSGDNQVGLEQFNDLFHAYIRNKDDWNTLIDRWEQQQRNHGQEG